MESNEAVDRAPEPCICVGIDFGTTHSGVAYAMSRLPDDVTIVKGWPTGRHLSHTKDESQVPTRLSYNNGIIEWGFGISENGKPVVEWFKLLMLEKEDLLKYLKKPSERIDAARASLHAAGKTARQAVADYLKLLWKHALAEMEQNYGVSGMRYPFKVAMTVPAIWPQYAVTRMYKAATEAGILAKRTGITDTSLVIVTEPEAAAQATFWTLKNRGNINAGDTYVVCDIGGGTTDIISYRVTKEPPYALEECAIGTGGLCGSLFVDEEFEILLKHKFGQSRWDKISAPNRKRLMNDEWEHGIKRNFRDDDRKDWFLQIPAETLSVLNMLSKKKLVDGLQVSTGELKGVFNATMDQSRTLIHNQVQDVLRNEGKPPKAIMLVGGFGKCDYVYNILKAIYEGQGIEILRPRGEFSDAWTAICRGAVLRAQNKGHNFVRSKISRVSYGIKILERYSSTKHNCIKDQKFLDDILEVYRVPIMKWLVKRGDKLNTVSPSQNDYATVYRTTEDGINDVQGLELSVYCSAKPEPPLDSTDPSIQRVCKIYAGMTVSHEDFEEKTSPSGKNYYSFALNIGLGVQDARVKFHVSRRGQKAGEQMIDVNYTTDPTTFEED